MRVRPKLMIVIVSIQGLPPHHLAPQWQESAPTHPAMRNGNSRFMASKRH
ncbi:MAG: hypothetical protein BWX48_03021 [Verrucomicrobia bacterium ADurb.Bin006]|nr:MAG: hypothetical protein BWX48_03021 [Verrucomicrobia bacterium ADurb.Bin006]